MMPPKYTVHPWLAHLQGLTSIMRARTKGKVPVSPSCTYFAAFDSSLNGSTWTVDYSIYLGKKFNDHVDHNEKMLIDLIQRTQRILQAAPSLFESSHPEAKADVERLLATARAQLSSVRAWPLRIPDYWQMETMHPQMEEAEISQLDIFPGRVHVYQSCQ